MSNGTIPFDTSGIDPNIIMLGKLAGLITISNELDTGWFADARGKIEEIPTARGADLVALLQGLLGSLSGSALSADNELGNPNTPHRSWYPLHNPTSVASGDDAVPAGLYLVVNTNDAQSQFIIGIGLLHTFHPDAFTLTTYAYFPLLELPGPSNSSPFLLGASTDYPVELGFELRGNSGAFGNQQVSFDGLKVGTSFSFGDAGTPSIDYEIVLLNLLLPGESTASNRSLHQLEAINANEWISTAISLFAAQIVNRIPPGQSNLAGETGNLIHNLLDLLGLAGDIESFDWQQLVSAGNVEALLSEWLGPIASSPATLRNWLNVWHCLRNGLLPATDGSDIPDHVKGSGTRADPWAITIFEAPGATPFTFNFTIATEVDAGDLHVFPGVRMNFTQAVPNIPQLGMRGEAAVELIELIYPASAGTTIAALEQRIFPSFELMAVAFNAADETKPLLSVADPSGNNGTLFSIGTIQAGLSYRENGAGNGRTLSPTFRLTAVTTKSGAWPEISLTNFDQDIKLLEDAIGPIVQSAIKDFLRVGKSDANNLAAGLAATLGVIPPEGAGSSWNVPLVIDDVDALVANPVGALGSYFTRCLNTPDSNSQPLVQHLLPEFARVLGTSTGTVSTQSGSGTPNDPWQIQLANIPGSNPDANLVAYLQLWQPTPNNNDLRFAIKLTSPLPLSEVTANLEVLVELLHLTLPGVDGSGAFGADWLRGVSARLRVRGPSADQYKLKTAPVAGVSIGLDDLLLSAGWDKQKQFYWAANIDNIALNASNQSPVVIGNLNFGSGTTAWEQHDLDTFTQLVISAAGMWLFEHGGKFGTLLTTGLGLLPSLPAAIQSQGITLPNDWPVFNLATLDPQLTNPSAFFTSPGSVLRPYLAQLFSKGEYAEPLMQMIGWAIDGAVPPQPATARKGTIDDPWSVKLKNAWGLELLFWTESDAGQTVPDYLGFGLRKSLNEQSVQDVALQALLTVYAVRLILKNGTAAATPIPSCSLSCLINNSDTTKPLFTEPTTNLGIESAYLGVNVDATGVKPTVRFTGTAGKVIELVQDVQSKAFVANESMQVMESALHALLTKLTAANQSFPLLQSVLDILADVEVVQVPAQNNLQSYGINIGSWNGFLADPMTFLTSQLGSVLQDPDASRKFSQHLGALTGFNLSLPDRLQGLPQFLAALGLMKSTADGYTISPSAWLDFIESPISYLETNGKRLLNDPEVRQQLLTALKTLPSSTGAADATRRSFSVESATQLPSRFNFKVSSGTQITIEIPSSNPLTIGPEVSAFGTLVVDLKSLQLTADLSLASPTVGSALAVNFALDAANNTAAEWSLGLEGAPSNLPPAFERLVIYPIPDVSAYLERIGTEVPLFVLSGFATKVLNQYVLPKSPLAARIFNAYAVTDGNGDHAKIESLLSLFLHPVDWALSADVFGDGTGKISPPRIADKIGVILGSNGFSIPAGISLVPGQSGKGMVLRGLPYGAVLSLAADVTDGVTVAVEISPTLPAPAPSIPAPTLQLSAGLSFGVNALAVSGGASLSCNLGPDAPATKLVIDSSYGKGSFQLDITAGGTEVALVPFGGLNQFISAASTNALLNYVGTELSQIYAKYRVAPSHNAQIVTFVDEVTQFAAVLNIHSLDDLVRPQTGALAQIKSDSVTWLSQWFSSDKAAATLQQLETLLTTTLF
ncbi:MAG TPA: hypothetical protein VFZ40_14800, partial [Pyrinomonadaceae bacterium]